jgi:hypothetical protein
MNDRRLGADRNRARPKDHSRDFWGSHDAVKKCPRFHHIYFSTPSELRRRQNKRQAEVGGSELPSRTGDRVNPAGEFARPVADKEKVDCHG